MITFLSGKVLLTLFLLLCICSDLKSMTIPGALFICMGSIEMIWYLYLYLYFNSSPLPLKEFLFISVLGFFLFLFAYISREGLGYGDVLFFLLFGLASGLSKFSVLLLLSLLLASVFSLIFISLCMLRGQSAAKKRIPLLPFTLLPALYLIWGEYFFR